MKRKAHAHEHQGELNIIPYLDIMVNLVMFMLMSMTGFVTFQMINTAAPEMAGQVTFNPTPLPVSSNQEEQPLHQLLGKLNWRPLGEGVRQTIEHFKKAVDSGRIDVERAIT